MLIDAYAAQVKTQELSPNAFSRRDFIKGGMAGVTGVLLVESIGCGGQSISAEVAIIQGAISGLQIIYPNISALGKIGKLGSDFNADWVAGKFDSARILFDNLDTLIGQTISDLEINASPRAKLLLATVALTLHTIAALIAEQGSSVAVRRAGVSTVNRIKVLADPSVADKLLKAVKTP